MGKTFNHATLATYDALHHTAKALDGGACLRHCHGFYRPDHSCSYRWQAVHRVLHEDKPLYEGEFSIRGYRYARTSVLSKFETWGSASAVERGDGAWDISSRETTKNGKPVRVITVKVVGEPFKTGFSPWPNNAHHLLPVAEIKNAIVELTESQPSVQRLIVQGLLEHHYNINHHYNQMILPQTFDVAQRLGLPTHARGDSHGRYSNSVKHKVKTILAPYKATIEQLSDNQPHPPPVESKDIKAKLEKLSNDLHAMIKDAAQRVRQAAAEAEDLSDSEKVKALSIDTFHTLVANIPV